MNKKIRKGERNNKSDNHEGTEIDFFSFGFFSNWEHDDTGKNISEKKIDKSEPGAGKSETERSSE